MEDELKKVSARFYCSEHGAERVRDWLGGLKKEDRKVIGTDVATVEYGWPVGMPTCRPMGGGLWEVRSNLNGNRVARILFCFADGHIILLHGFIKTAKKTAKADLEIARTRQKEIER